MTPSPSAFRAMRAALDWSLRDAAAETGIAFNTLLKIEGGQAVTDRLARRVVATFRKHGVSYQPGAGEQQVIKIGAPTGTTKDVLPPELVGVPHLAIRGPRADGTYRVLFELPAKDRPAGWLATRPLPFTHPRRGDLTDKVEVKAIRRDADDLREQLNRDRARAKKTAQRAG